MQYLHSQDPIIIHRDLKPGNVLVTRKLRAKICDFGLSRHLNQTFASTVGNLVGTPGYIAPELLRAEPYNEKVDVWSFGLIFYEVFARRRPYSPQRTSYEILAAVMMHYEHPEFPRLSDVGLMVRLLDMLLCSR